jgi:hypothetical protein
VNRYNDDLDGKRLDITVEYLVRGLDDVNRYNDDLDGKVLDIGVRYHRIKRSPQGGNSLPCLDTAAPSSSTRAAGPTSLVQHFTFNINGAGAPQATVAEIERYLRKAGDPSKVTVSAP